MTLPPGPLLSLAAALGTFLPGSFCGSPSHSLSYFYWWQLPEPSQGPPQFFIRGYLDDQPIARFDSLTRKMEPLVSWMEEVEKERFLAPEWVFSADLKKISKQDPHAGVLHTWQMVLGCELKEDGSKGGFLHYGYDGMDFISFDKETLRWVTAQSEAQKVKEKWEEDSEWSEKINVFLEETCTEWLQTYLLYEKKVLEIIEPPVGKVIRKVVDDRLEVLVCQAFGFYPQEIWTTWTRDGEVCEYETLHRNVVPNSDGTYYVLLSIEIDPKERDHFQCHLEHEGLQEPLVLAFKEETEWWIPVAVVIALILGFACLFLLYDKIQSEPILQSEVTAEDMEYGEWSPQTVVEDSESTLHRQEGKQQPLRRPKTWAGESETMDKAEATESEERRLWVCKAEKVTVRKTHSVPPKFIPREEDYYNFKQPQEFLLPPSGRPHH